MTVAVQIVNEPRPWIKRAACLGSPPNIFFPGSVGVRPVSANACIAGFSICATCSVTEECFDWAMSEGEREGIYGGRFIRGGRTVYVATFVAVRR